MAATGIDVREAADGRKRYRASVWDNSAGRRIYKTFPTEAAAKNWRRNTEMLVKTGQLRASEPLTVAEAFTAWLKKAEAGEVRARGGRLYKPSVLVTYELSFTGRLLKRFGRVRVGELDRRAIQRYVDELVGEGLAPQTVRNTLLALRVLMKWCVREGYVPTNPCEGLELPSGETPRDRIVPASEAVALLKLLDDPVDRAIMATAFFSGLRRGELMALRWEDVDLANRRLVVHPTRGNFDAKTYQFVAPKSKKGARTVGLPEVLVPYLTPLAAEALGVEVPVIDQSALVFGRTLLKPFQDRALAGRVRKVWGKDYVSLHEARHTYASLMIAAGVNIKTISEWMGHSSVTITLDRYGHLLPGSAAVALGLINDYLKGEL